MNARHSERYCLQAKNGLTRRGLDAGDSAITDQQAAENNIVKEII